MKTRPTAFMRISAALRLEPMTDLELARALSITHSSACRSLRELESRRLVRRLSDGSAWINEPRRRRQI